jgi:hypothetical protein
VAKAASVAEPLTDQDYRDLNRAEYIVNQLLPQLDKARLAGRPVSDLQLRRDDLASQVTQIKGQYYPGRQ